MIVWVEMGGKKGEGFLKEGMGLKEPMSQEWSLILKSIESKTRLKGDLKQAGATRLSRRFLGECCLV